MQDFSFKLGGKFHEMDNYIFFPQKLLSFQGSW